MLPNVLQRLTSLGDCRPQRIRCKSAVDDRIAQEKPDFIAVIHSLRRNRCRHPASRQSSRFLFRAHSVHSHIHAGRARRPRRPRLASCACLGALVQPSKNCYWGLWRRSRPGVFDLGDLFDDEGAVAAKLGASGLPIPGDRLCLLPCRHL